MEDSQGTDRPPTALSSSPSAEPSVEGQETDRAAPYPATPHQYAEGHLYFIPFQANQTLSGGATDNLTPSPRSYVSSQSPQTSARKLKSPSKPFSLGAHMPSMCVPTMTSFLPACIPYWGPELRNPMRVAQSEVPMQIASKPKQPRQLKMPPKKPKGEINRRTVTKRGISKDSPGNSLSRADHNSKKRKEDKQLHHNEWGFEELVDKEAKRKDENFDDVIYNDEWGIEELVNKDPRLNISEDENANSSQLWDEVIQEIQKEDSDKSSGLEDPGVDTSLEVFPYEAERQSIQTRLLGKMSNTARDTQLQGLTMYFPRVYMALEMRAPWHLRETCPAPAASSIDELKRCCWREQEAQLMEQNVDKALLPQMFRKEVTAVLYNLMVSRKRRRIKWPFHVKRTFRIWLDEHAGETWDTPSVHACEVLSKEVGVPAEKIRSFLKAQKYKEKNSAAKKEKELQTALKSRKHGKRACIAKQLNEEQRHVLKKWAGEHMEWPFPDEEETATLMQQTNLVSELVHQYLEFYVKVAFEKFPKGAAKEVIFKHPVTDESKILLPNRDWRAKNIAEVKRVQETMKAHLAFTPQENQPDITRLEREIEETRTKRREKEEAQVEQEQQRSEEA